MLNLKTDYHLFESGLCSHLKHFQLFDFFIPFVHRWTDFAQVDSEYTLLLLQALALLET